jgi:RNA polymerase sigma-70 factor (ECF subfamily)
MTAAETGVRTRHGFADFYRTTFGDLASYAGGLVRDVNLGDELAQEALTRVYVRWAVLRDPRPYAYRIVTNLARDAWRSAARERAAATDLIREPTEAPDTGTLDAVLRLPPALRDVVLLHYYADLPVADVARAVHRPAGTVKRRLHEARTALAVTLEDRS